MPRYCLFGHCRVLPKIISSHDLGGPTQPVPASGFLGGGAGFASQTIAAAAGQAPARREAPAAAAAGQARGGAEAGVRAA